MQQYTGKRMYRNLKIYNSVICSNVQIKRDTEI